MAASKKGLATGKNVGLLKEEEKLLKELVKDNTQGLRSKGIIKNKRKVILKVA